MAGKSEELCARLSQSDYRKMATGCLLGALNSGYDIEFLRRIPRHEVTSGELGAGPGNLDSKI